MATHPLSLKRVGTGKFGFEQYHGESLTENPNCPACLSNRKVTEIRSDETVAGYDMVQDRPAFLEIKVKRYKCSLHNEFVDPYTPFGSSKLGYTSDYRGFVGAAYLSSKKSANQVKEEFEFPHISDAIHTAMENCKKMVACFTECDSLFLNQFEYGKRMPVAVFGRPTNKKLGKTVLLTICDDAQEAVELFASGKLIFPKDFLPDSQIYIDGSPKLFDQIAAALHGSPVLALLRTDINRILQTIDSKTELAQKHITASSDCTEENCGDIDRFGVFLKACVEHMGGRSVSLASKVERILDEMESMTEPLRQKLSSEIDRLKAGADHDDVITFLDNLYDEMIGSPNKQGPDFSFLTSLLKLLNTMICFDDDRKKNTPPGVPGAFWGTKDNPTPAQAQKLIAKMEEMCADKIGYEVAKLRVIYQDKFHRLMCRDNSCAKHFDYLKRYGEENAFALSLYSSGQPAFFMEAGKSAAHGPLYRTMFSDAFPWREIEGYRAIYNLVKHWSYEEPPTWNESLNEAMPNFDGTILPWPECPLWVDCCTALTE